MASLPEFAPGRRRFLLGYASATAAAALAPVSEAEAYDPGKKETATRYQETEHVQAFYRTNAYEGVRK